MTIDELNKQENEFKRLKYPTVPAYALTKAKNKEGNKSGDLIKLMKNFCTLNRQFSEEVQTKGTWREDKNMFTAGNYTKGSADCHIMIWSKKNTLIVWKCEVKIKKDSQKKHQKKYENAINEFANRGKLNNQAIVLYSIVKTFDDFVQQYNKLMEL